ncbi:MAG: hypothetical protein H7335_06425 [Massilia sp.]|nr:hypothetical protein [Massilia sp.]
MTDLFKLCAEIAALPVAVLHFRTRLHPVNIRTMYGYFTMPHPRYKVFKNKALGAALVHLGAFATGDEFLASLKRSGDAAANRKKALARGHRLCEIDRNALVDAIHQINISCSERQGRPMDSAYLKKPLHYEDLAHYRYYGVFDRDDTLVAYCNVGVFGNFASTDQLMGFKNNSGVMYFLLTEITCKLIEERQLEYLMYDTIFGAMPGMRAFKHRLGFQPYRARYLID